MAKLARPILVLAAAAALPAAACTRRFALEDEPASGAAGAAGLAGAAGAAGADTGAGGVAGDAGPESDAGPALCKPGALGPALIAVPPHAPMFCIDATEVTNAQYAAWIDTGPSVAAQPPRCAWNNSFQPSSWIGGKSSDFPVATIDWCDALAFCQAAGKRLCGKVGGGAIYDNSEFQQGEWHYACSAGGTKKFPYGDDYEPGRCNDWQAQNGNSVKVGSLPGCEGGWPGIFDMSGNMWEFQDTCHAVDSGDVCDPNDGCNSIGGSWLKESISYACAGSIHGGGCNVGWANQGFRCCADWVP